MDHGIEIYEFEGMPHVIGRLQAPNGFKLKNDEYFCQCPYEAVHVVLNTRFDYHLLKCRHNHIKKMEKAGKQVVYGGCRFDLSHRVISIEADYHEYICSAKYDYFYRSSVGLPPNKRSIIKVNSAKPPPKREMREGSVESTGSSSGSSSRESTPELELEEALKVNLGHSNFLVEPLPKDPTYREIWKYLQKVHEVQKMSGTEGQKWEDWETEANLFPVTPYDPQKKLDKVHRPMYLTAPGITTKAERREFRLQQQLKTERVYDPNDSYFNEP